MLVLSRKPGEALLVGNEIRLRVVSVSGQQVRLAIEAPAEVAVHREEVFERIAAANREAAAATDLELPRLPGAAEPQEGEA